MTVSAKSGNLAEWRSRQDLQRFRSFRHGRMLLRQARKELDSAKRLAAINVGFPLANDAWILLLQVLVNTLSGKDTTVSDLSDSCDIKFEIVVRYLKVLEKEQLLICSQEINRAGPVSIGDAGLLKLARYFLPQAANE